MPYLTLLCNRGIPKIESNHFSDVVRNLTYLNIDPLKIIPLVRWVQHFLQDQVADVSSVKRNVDLSTYSNEAGDQVIKCEK